MYNSCELCKNVNCNQAKCKLQSSKKKRDPSGTAWMELGTGLESVPDQIRLIKLLSESRKIAFQKRVYK
jgi:hypothetical protein